jgi:hypothetical protein
MLLLIEGVMFALIFFDMEPVVGSFFASQHIIELEGTGAMGNQFINLF